MTMASRGDYIRPMTVMEALGEGRYRCFYGGAHYEVFSTADSDFQVGDLVIARMVSGAGELFVPYISMARLFFWPGISISDDRARIYEYVDEEVVERWTAPVENHQTGISWCGWFDGSLIVCTIDQTNTNLITGVKLYSLNVSTWEATNLGFATTLNPGGDSDFNYILDGAEFAVDGCLYMVGFYDDGIPANDHIQVLKYDPVHDTLTEVFDAGDYWTPSIAVLSDTRLIMSNGYEAYYSDNGTIWTLSKDFSADEGSYDQGSMHTNAADGRVYLGGNRSDAGMHTVVIWDTANGTSWASTDLSTEIGNMVLGLGMEFISSGGEPDYVYAVTWATDASQSPTVYRRIGTGGTWALDWVGPGNDWETAQDEPMASIDGEIFLMVVKVEYPYTNSRSRLYRRTDSTWALVQEFSAWHGWGNVTIQNAGIIRATGTMGCHES